MLTNVNNSTKKDDSSSKEDNQMYNIERSTKPKKVANTVKVDSIDREIIRKNFLMNERDPDLENVGKLPQAKFQLKTKIAPTVDHTLKRKVEVSAMDVFTNKHEHSPTKNPIKRSYHKSGTISNSAPFKSMIDDIELLDNNDDSKDKNKNKKNTQDFAFNEEEIEEDNKSRNKHVKFMSKGSHQINSRKNESLTLDDSSHLNSSHTGSKYKPSKFAAAEDEILNQFDLGQIQLKIKQKPKTNTTLPVVIK